MIELKDFKKESDVPKETIEKYRNILPAELIEVWENYGFGSFYGGFLKTVNPEGYIEVLHETAPFFEKEIVMFSTGLADLITWELPTEEDTLGYAHILFYRVEDFKALTAESLEFFFDSIIDQDEFLRDKRLLAAPYFKAVKQQGEPAYDEAFGYTPLLVLGGNDNIESLQKVDLMAHIALISAFHGGPVFDTDEPSTNELKVDNQPTEHKVDSEPKKKKFFGLF
ncbi:T6SS immunity protein Tdi1 domain-containing protein [Periweissella cryptocerci]|nr:T6SS immunity protein Tdi1 domain-containing protein [Periweissella cryptocerci]